MIGNASSLFHSNLMCSGFFIHVSERNAISHKYIVCTHTHALCYLNVAISPILIRDEI